MFLGKFLGLVRLMSYLQTQLFVPETPPWESKRQRNGKKVIVLLFMVQNTKETTLVACLCNLQNIIFQE